MPHLYLDKRKNPPIWRFQIWDAQGRRKSFTGTTSKRETVDMAVRRQAYEKELSKGVREEKKIVTPSRSYDEVKQEYLNWGNTQGGRNGRAWGKTTSRMREAHLDWWGTRLKLQTLEDLRGCLPSVEQALRQLKDKGTSGKTLFHYSSALRAFISWCEHREYIDKDPLRRLGKLDTSPQSQRRALSMDEIKQLLDACDEFRRILYETAFCSGLRAGELRSLTRNDLDTKNNGLILRAHWTKNRKSGFQPLPHSLVKRLAEFADAKTGSSLYQFTMRDTDHKPPPNPLLYVPSHPAREFDKDLKKAGIPKITEDGKVDFHACRVAYISHLVESGADVKVVQTLARHSDPRITLAVYAKVRPERLVNAVEAFGKSVLAG